MNEIYLRKNGTLWERQKLLIKGLTSKLLLYYSFRQVL